MGGDGFFGRLGRLGGFLGGGGEFLFDVDGVAGDVFAALAEEEPDKYEDGAAEDKEAVFDRVRPAGGEENKSIHDAEADGVEVAAGEDDFFREGEIALREGIFGAVVGVAE